VNDTSHSLTNQIKIFHLITNLGIGGTQNGLLVNLHKLSCFGFTNIVCSVTSDSTLAADFEANDIPVYTLDMNRKSDIFAISRLSKILKKEKPDILHTYLFHANLIGTLAGRFSGIPIIVNSERIVPNKGFHRRIISRGLNKVTHAIETNSQANKNYICRKHNIDQNKISVILPGFELNNLDNATRVTYRKILNISQSEFLIGCFGRLDQQKGFEYAIKALSQIDYKDRKIKLIIVGEGPERSLLMNMVHELNLTNEVMLLGQRTDIQELMCATDLVFVPSRYEGLPRVVLEGMMAEKPIVATNVGGVSEVVEDTVNGLLVPPDDVQLMVQAISRIVHDSGFARSIAKVGMDYARTNFSQERYIKELHGFYLRLIEQYSSQFV